MKIKQMKTWVHQEDLLLLESQKNQPFNWNIASLLLSSHSFKRSAHDCEQHWKRVLDPNLQKGRFSQSEDIQLINLISRHGSENINLLSDMMKTRSYLQIRNRMKTLKIDNFLSVDSNQVIINQEMSNNLTNEQEQVLLQYFSG